MTGPTAAVGASPCSRKHRFISDLAKEQRRFGVASGGSCLQVTLELSQPLDGARLTHQRDDLEETGAHRLPRECHAGRMDEGTRLHTSGLRNVPQRCLGCSDVECRELLVRIGQRGNVRREPCCSEMLLDRGRIVLRALPQERIEVRDEVADLLDPWLRTRLSAQV
jgi:hypothetical protein